MSQPFVGEIRMFAGNFAPAGWMFCDGSQLAISEYETLFNLIGTTYGGDGQSTFNLPDLQSRIPIHQGTGGVSTYVLAQTAGEEQVTLTTPQIPAHTHVPLANTNSSSISPSGTFWAGSADLAQFGAPSSGQMNPQTVQNTGGSQPHDNRVPFLAINFIISLFGVFPSQT
jgi:microcystin-dependent protein